MKKFSWAMYGLGIAVVVFVLMSSELGSVAKSLIVAATLFVGALIAAIHELARAIGGREAPSQSHTDAEKAMAASD